MKKQISLTFGLSCFLAWPTLLLAQSTPPPSVASKIAVINIQGAIANTAEGKKAFDDLQKKYQPRRQELERQQQEISALQDQLQKQSPTLSDEERLRLNRELDDKQKLFKRSTEDANADFQADQQDVVRRIGQKMVRLINDYAQQNAYTLVMDDSQIPVYYVAKEAEITDEIVKRFDAANPVAQDSSEKPVLSSPTGTPGDSRPASAKPPATKPPAKSKP